MSLSAIKTNLNTQIAAVSGVTTAWRDALGTDGPRTPKNEECPLTVIESDDPTFDAAPVANGITQYTWHLIITIFSKPVTVDTHATRVQSVEDIPAGIRARLAANNSLGGTAKSVRFTSSGKLGYFEKFGGTFYGGQVKIDVFENVTETYAA
jgi:hypothetical protein